MKPKVVNIGIQRACADEMEWGAFMILFSLRNFQPAAHYVFLSIRGVHSQLETGKRHKRLAA